MIPPKRPRDPALLRRRRLANGVFVALALLATGIALLALLLILGTLVSKGLGGMSADVVLLDQPGPGESGGLRNALVGSAMMCGLGMVLAVVVGVLAGTWLAEYGDGKRLASFVRFLNDVLLSAPSILMGLFVYEAVVRPLHGFSAGAGALALGFLATPVVTRTTEDMLRLQPHALREAGMALGAGKGHVVRSIIWRASRSGLVTGALLGLARISGETAPLLFTSPGNPFLSFRIDQSMASLPTLMFQYALSAYDDWQALAWAGALLIAAAVLAANIIGRVLTRGSFHK
ncbi:phosphate ABC transporter permease PstA [Novosphingobium rosa]|uniref:phosphate ABC transporter permease PstA n=1 Tax=Novosphingobium rosa TaxID=76978 RepID=UPI0008376DE1|nr:phosphate ABC transporter permease PstA [Novosphingobium rosa]